MNSDIKNVAAFLAVAIWADGVYADEEKAILDEITLALKVDKDILIKEVDDSVKSLEKKNEEQIAQFLIENASVVDEEDAVVLMECAIEIVLADNVITKDEVETLFDLADATGVVEHSDVVLMIADLVKTHPEIEVKF